MAKPRTGPEEFGRPIRRILVGLLVFLLMAIFLLWRIDSPRVERFRAALVDRVVPSFEWALVPVTKAAAMIDDYQSYTRIYEQNQELRRELQQMKAWKEAPFSWSKRMHAFSTLIRCGLTPSLPMSQALFLLIQARPSGSLWF